MKNAIIIILSIFFAANLGFSQNSTQPKPVKKVVTSKITKDPKTGKIVKTITTITTTDIVLVPGKASEAVKPIQNSAKVASSPKQTVTKKPVVNTKVVAKKPAVKPKVVATKSKPVPTKSVVVAKEENNSIFANPKDNSSNNTEKTVKEQEEKSEINTPFVDKPNISKAPNTTNTANKPANKVFKEKVKTGNTYFGIRGGANFSSVENAKSFSGLSSATVNKNIGVNTGIFLNFGLSKMISLQPEVNFTQTGYELTNGIESETLNNQSINVPVLLKLSTGGPKVKFFVNGGPYAGFLLKAQKISVLANQTITSIVNFADQDGKEIKVNRFDYGLQAGTGFQFDLGGPKLEIEGRYNYGLADPMVYTVTKPSYIGQTGRNRTITGTIGLMFPIGK